MTAASAPSQQKLDVVTTCRSRNLPALCLAAERLRLLVPFKKLHVITARRNFRKFANALGGQVSLLDEDSLIPGLTLRLLKTVPQPLLTRYGWYFQQLLKFQFAFQDEADDHYLIWDADTVPLREMNFFDDQGRMIFTIADWHNQAYFDTYEKLLGEHPHREFSFITQHMIVRKSVLREMLGLIERRFAGPENWAWKIMRNLGGEGYKRFSEYETYGHFIKNHYPQLAIYRRLPWLHEGGTRIGLKPTAGDLDQLKEHYYFVAFEAYQTPLQRAARRLRGTIVRWLRSAKSPVL